MSAWLSSKAKEFFSSSHFKTLALAKHSFLLPFPSYELKMKERRKIKRNINGTDILTFLNWIIFDTF